MNQTESMHVEPARAQSCPCAASGEPVQIDRRDFLTRSAAVLAAVALGACGSLTSPGSPNTVSSTSFQLSSFPALANVGGVATTTISGVPIAIVRESSTSFSAFSRICPHQGTTINVFSNEFQCPRHGATFNLQGQWIGGQPTGNLASYPVAYDAASGTITVGG